jgi:hypothetical protein
VRAGGSRRRERRPLSRSLKTQQRRTSRSTLF